MSIFTRAADALLGGVARRQSVNVASGIIPPPRDSSAPVLTREAAHLPAVHRALQIIGTSVGQLGLTVERGSGADRVILEGADVPAYIRRPNLDMSRAEFLEQIALSMATSGNGYIWREGGDLPTETNELHPLSPHTVTPWRDEKGRLFFAYDGKDYPAGRAGKVGRIVQTRYLTLPGSTRGIGPIAAAQTTMRSARDMREYSSNWWETGHPSGILSTDDKLTGDDARTYRRVWNHLDPATGEPIAQDENPSRIRVLGKGLHYEPLMISPKDALWIEAQQFDTLEIARIFGVPSSLMMTAIDGNSMTYSNVEQEWLGFVRFGLMAYLRKIEDALTALTPRGQRVRFNLDALLRSDTTTRYRAHESALRAGWLTPDEVRGIENMPPLTAAQREQIAATTPAPAPQENPA
ncbi:phage portal protein [Brachybacterium sp. YJGR34]|uniref:phage portal protein n=1 Tax=Brachybacterium sp. YJGR34 TaxID=2059911 RepID=UPI000E0CBE26|nr:phage portal protein [Brachybacterium sp. YJGR34]